MRVLTFHHTYLGAIRSHQWKYCLDPYLSCDLQCHYCLREEADARQARVRPDLFSALEMDLASLPLKQIIFASPRVDPYVHLEKRMRVTRRVLEILLKYETPLVLLTKSPLILRDIDLLQEFNKRSLLLAQFTLLTTNVDKTRMLEAATAAPRERLAACRELSKAGIPVHVHISPLIPGLYAEGELQETIKAISDAGGRCIYTSYLVIRPTNRKAVFKTLEKIGQSESQVRQWYPTLGQQRVAEHSPDYERLVPDMWKMKEICQTLDMSFVCEFIPALNSLKWQDFEGGVFRFGIPAVYDMLRYWDDKGGASITWDAFEDGLLSKYAMDPEYRRMVRALWDRGELFDNTYVTPRRVRGEITYAKGDQLHVKTLLVAQNRTRLFRSILGRLKKRAVMAARQVSRRDRLTEQR